MPTLYLSTTSPYTRMLLTIAAIEKTPLQLRWVVPWENPDELTKVNPFSQVPALIWETGEVITETPLIIQSIAPALYRNSSKQTLAKIAQALTITAQGVRGFSILRFGEKDVKPHPFVARSSEFLNQVLPTLPTLSTDSEDWGDRLLLCALVWIQNRLPEVFDHLSDTNKEAVNTFKNSPLQAKLDAKALEAKPSTSLEVIDT